MEKLRGQPQDGEARERLATDGRHCYPRAEGAAGKGGFIGAWRLGQLEPEPRRGISRELEPQGEGLFGGSKRAQKRRSCSQGLHRNREMGNVSFSPLSPLSDHLPLPLLSQIYPEASRLRNSGNTEQGSGERSSRVSTDRRTSSHRLRASHTTSPVPIKRG